MPSGDELSTELSRQLGTLLTRLRPQSLAALGHAMAVSELEGVGGTLIIKLPSHLSGDIEVSFLTGRVRLELEM